MWISITPYVISILIVGLGIAGAVALRPRLFWPILIFVAVGTLGLKVQGYCLVDEYFTGCVLIGSLLAISIGAAPPRREPISNLNYLHILIFYLMITYMIAESIRGLVLWGDPRLMRWVIYYAMLGMLLFIISKRDFPVPSARNTALVVSWSALLYFAAYLGQGFYAEAFRHASRFSTQGFEWAGSAGATFPLVAAVPAAIFLLRDSARKWRGLGVALIVVSMIVAYYYDSRVAYLVIMAFLIASPTVLGLRRAAIFVALVLVALGGIYFFGSWAGFMERISRISQMLSGSVDFLWSPRASDVDRYALMYASFSAVNANLWTWLFGYGIYSERFVIVPYLRRLYGSIPGVNKSLGNLARTEAFEALFIDTGYIGMLLLTGNFFFVALSLIAQKSPMRIILLLALVLTFLWLFVADIQDAVLLYLIIMPMGPLAQLGQRRTATQALSNLSAN